MDQYFTKETLRRLRIRHEGRFFKLSVIAFKFLNQSKLSCYASWNIIYFCTLDKPWSSEKEILRQLKKVRCSDESTN